MADPIVLTAPSYDYALTLANLGIPDDGNDHSVTFYLSSDQAAHGKLFSGSFEVHYSAAPDGETFTIDSDSIKTGNYRFVADDATQASSFDYQYDGAARQTYTFDAIPVVHAPTASGYLPGTDTAATAGVFVAPAGLVTDSDDDNSVSTIAISLGNGADKGDTLDFMTHAVPGDHGGYISGVADGQILYTTFDSSNTPNQPVAIGSYTFDGTTLTFTRDTSVLGEDTTIASKVLQAVHFDTISTSPDTRTLTYVATDAHGATNATATETVRPNTPPVVDLDTTDGSTATGSTTTLVIGTDGNASDKPGYPGFDIAPHSAVSDDGANFNGGSLVVTTTASGQGAPSVDLEGELPGSGFRYVGNGIVVDGGAQDGTLVATLTIDNSTNTFTWQFVSPLASASLVNALIRSFSTGVDHSTVGANADVAFALTDSDGATTTVHGLVTVVVNTPPVVDIDGAGTANAVTLAYTENGAATAIAPNLSISDMFAGHAATSLAGGNVTVAIINNVAVGDVLAFGDGVTLSQNATYVNAYDVAVNGIVIGTVAKGATTTLYVTLNASATTANVQALLDSVTYHSTSENPSTAARTVTYTVDDGQGGSTHIGTATATVNVTAVNDAPVLDIDGAGTANAVALSYTEHDAATKIAPALTVSDVDSANFSGGHAIVSLGTTAASGDVLSFGSGVTTTPHNGTTGLFDVSVGSTVIGTTTAVGGTAIDVTLNAAATPALVQTLVEAVSYSNISTNHPSTVDRTVSYSVSDGNGTDAGTGTATATIHVATVDNAPTVLNPTPTINEDTATTFTVAQLATDKDGDALTITAATGTHGTVVIGADHQSLLFTPDQDYNGAASFTYTVSDGTKTTDGQTNLTVTPVNDAPVIDLNGGTVTDGINTVLSYTENEVGDRGGYAKVAPGALVSDVDNTTFPNGTLTVTLSNAQGADSLSSFSNDGSGLLYNSSTSQYYYDPSVTTVLSSYNFAANADKQITGPISSTGTSRTFTFTANATADAVRVLAEHIAFKNDSDNPATLPRDVTFVLTDGSGGTSATAHAAINVTAVNDAPVAIASVVTATEDASYTFKAADFQYTDAESNGLKSVTIVTLPSAASGALTLHGTAVAANAIIAATDIGSLVYTPVHDQNGPVSFTFNVQDDGGTANQGVDTGVAAATLTINVGAVNDAPTVVGTTQAAATILEDMPSTAGQTVTALFGAHFSDAADAVTGGSTANAFAGVAITADGSTDAVGHWQYLAGGVWTNIPTVSDAKAFVLSSTDQIRFSPAQDVNSGNATIPTLTAHVVETGGAASGATVDLSTAGTTGGTSHYSTGTVVLSESVTPVNDAPVVNLQGAAFTYTENGPAHLVAPTATVVDVDSANFSGGTLTVSVAGGLAEDQLSIVSTITGISVNGTNVVYGAFSVGPIFGMPGTGFFNPGTTIGTVAGGTNGTPLVVTLNANATPAMTQALVDAIAYGDSSENPAKGAHNISFVLSDGAAGAGGATSLTQTAAVTVMPVDDAPVAVADVATTNDTVAVHTTATSGGLLANDTDVDGPAVSIAQINGKAVVFDTAITLASGALLTVHADGSYDYDPNGKFEYLGAPGSGGQSVATDSFTYTLAGPAPTLSGGIGGTAATDLRTATATITLNGVDNNDTLSGITLTGASGHNDVNAGEGNNSITVTNATGTNTIETGAGNDTIHVTSTSGMTTISAGAGDDVVVAHGTGSFVINGGAGNDDLEAGSGNDRIYAGDGNDLVHGGSGAGNDFYDGGTGTDTLTYASTTLGVVVDMHAIDRSSNPDIRQVLDDAGQYTTDSMGVRHYTPVGIAVGAESGTDAFINFENLTGGSGDDVLTGDDNANVIMGGAGNDTIMGGGGNDTLDGGTGINTLSYAGQTDAVQVNLASGQVNAGGQGGSDTVSNFQNVILGNGNDQFIGNDQNNVIEGGPGNDQIDGAGGYDTVIYRGIAPTDGMATQAFDQLRVNAGVLGTDTLTNVEEIDFVNATGTTVVKVVNGNAVVTEVADTGSVGQAGTLTVAAAGGVLANDINLDQGGTDLKTVIGVAHSVTTGTTTTTTTGTVGSAIVGDHGSLTLNADGSYVYVANDATKALAAGATYTDVFTYTAGDGDSGQSTPTTLTITITGTNDLPVVGGAVVGGVTEDVNVSTDGLHTIGTSGVLAISDTDTVPVSEAQFRPIPAVAGTYGTFTLAANGAWTYAADDTQTAIQQLGQGKTATDSFVATSYDGTTSEVVTVTITGTNDAPKLTAGTLATFTDSAATDAFTAISGKIAGIVPDTTAIGTLADADVGDKYSYRVVDTTPNTTYGTFALDSTGHYTFTPDSAAINALKAPTSVTYTIEVNDGSGATNATSQATFTVQLNGANDTASFDPTSKFAGSVTEDVGVSTDGTHTIATSGTILVKDVDTGDAGTVAQTGNAGKYGVFAIDASGHWTYAADDSQAAIQALGKGETLTETFAVSSIDGTATQNVVVTINGTNDRPVLTGGSLGQIYDTAANDSFGNLSGQIANTTTNAIKLSTFAIAQPTGSVSPTGKVGTLADVDTNDKHSFTLAETTAQHTANDGYGTLSVASDGSYTFAPNNAAVNALAAGETKTLTYTVQVDDGSGVTGTGSDAATNTGDFTITLHGVNDTPVFGGSMTGNVKEDVNVQTTGGLFTSAVHTIGTSGLLTIADADHDQSVFQPTTTTDSFGTFAIGTNGAWTFTTNNDALAVQQLGEGATVTHTYNAVALDGTVQPVTITLTGTNDNPVFLAGTADDGQSLYARSVTESDAALALHGTLHTSDDVGDTDTFAYTASTDGHVSASGVTLTTDQVNAIKAAFAIDGSGNYSFNLPSPDYLDAGQVVTATFNVHAHDQLGADTVKAVTVTITGSEEVVTVDPNATTTTGGNYGDLIVVPAGAGDTIVYGLGGNDQITGGNGDDHLYGGAGDDTIYGGAGDNTLDGGSGNDKLYGGAGDDTLLGGSGDDLLSGGLGNNVIDGGSGTNTGVLQGVMSDYTITATANGGLLFTTGSGATLERDTFTNVQRFQFSDGLVYTPTGQFGPTFDVSATTAPYSLTTTTGRDTILVGATLTAGDHIDGNGGADQLVLSGDYTGAHALVLNDQTVTHIPTMVLAASTTDTPNAYDITAADGMVAAGTIMTVYGGLLASNESFTFDGSAEKDGAFKFFGGAGADTLTGGAGDDAFYFGPNTWDPTKDTVVGGGGTQNQLGLYGQYTTTLDHHAGVQTVVLFESTTSVANTYDVTVTDDFFAVGGTGKAITANSINGFVSTALTIDASAVTDSTHHLTIIGGTAGDMILGGAGDDLIFGGGGADTLLGGGGSDTFWYTAASQSSGTSFDTIDYQSGTDHIRIGSEIIDTRAGYHETDVTASGTYTSTGVLADDLAGAATAGGLSATNSVFFTETSGANQGQFMIVEGNGQAGYQEGSDYVFQIVPVQHADTMPHIMPVEPSPNLIA